MVRLILKKIEEKNVLFCFKRLLLIILIGLDRLIDNPCQICSVLQYIQHLSKSLFKSVPLFFTVIVQIGGWVGGSATIRTLFRFRKRYGKMDAP